MKFWKVFLVFVFGLILWMESVGFASASLVTIDDLGEVTVNVLADEDSVGIDIPQKETVSVYESLSGTKGRDTRVTLSNADGNVVLNVVAEGSEKAMDVTNYKDNLVEIEERPAIEKIAIKTQDNKFLINQKGVFAETSFPIEIDPKTTGLTLETPSGLRFLGILPKDAVNTLLRTKIINHYSPGKSLKIEEDNSQLAYLIEGEKVFNLAGVVQYPLKITAKISATTGEIIEIQSPNWLKFLSFLLV